MNIFITGNVGSGKSTFLNFLKNYVNHEFYEFIDLDLIAKKIIKDFNIKLPFDIQDKGRNAVFEQPEILFELENQILPHIPKYFPKTDKTFILEASTLIECPTLLTKDDIIIHVSSKNSIQQTLSRDNIENRAYLISRVQVSPFVKHLISDIEIDNSGTLNELEEQAKLISNNLNYQKTESFLNTICSLTDFWNSKFENIDWSKSIIRKYISVNRNSLQQNYLLSILKKFSIHEHEFSPLWVNAIYLAIWFHAYELENHHFSEKSVIALWNFAKLDNQFTHLIYGSRSYLSLACELILALHAGRILSNNLSYGEPKKAFDLLQKLTG